MDSFPQQVGPYVLLRRIGVGGMGVVYEARCTDTHRIVAIKFLHPRANVLDLERFSQEILAIQRLTRVTPGIASYLDHGVTQGSYWVAMERVHGPTLREHLKSGPITRTEAIAISLQILRTCQAAHGEDIIHRDIKPDNVILPETETGVSAKLLDFGVARLRARFHNALMDIEITPTDWGQVVGTPRYMSPEQLQSRPVTPATDVFSLGCILYLMLTNRDLYPGSTFQDIISSRSNDLPAVPDARDNIDQELWDVLRGCLQRIPANRARVPALINTLQTYLPSTPEHSHPRHTTQSIALYTPAANDDVTVDKTNSNPVTGTI